MNPYKSIIETPIEYLKGVGPQRADVLKKELGIFQVRDLLFHLPFRYVDRTQFHAICNINAAGEAFQLKGMLRKLETLGEGPAKRLVGNLRDDTGSIDLVWFRSIHWVQQSLVVNKEYIVYGRPTEFNGRFNIAHPEIEDASGDQEKPRTFDPVYPSTDKLTQKGLDAKGIRKLISALFEQMHPSDLPETLPKFLKDDFKLLDRFSAMQNIHFPQNRQGLDAATRRLKFEELFFMQLRLLQIKHRRKDEVRGFNFATIGPVFNNFYQNHLPFQLTNAQKRVLKEIRSDLGSGAHMNRLVQGDVGSGKTIVALLTMLMAIDNGFQACLMAPTEILAQQHHIGLGELLKDSGIIIEYLSGSIKGKKRKAILEQLAAGEIHILVGTHALIEPEVVFKNIGISVIDEQHRFGVEQRAKLYIKNPLGPPHILVMTATPIPRTLAMTLYGDLEVSIIDELPPGRKPITTLHKTEHHRMSVFGLMRDEIAKGRQVYMVFPMIEETEKSDLKNLMEGYEAVTRDFPLPQYQVSILHGKMKSADKDFEMQRFVSGQTNIMIATTVIEVGVNVPNASVMVIENSERFGLSQLHQLRGRVGRGAEQSFCILMTSFKLSHEGRERIATMVRTNNGFEIAEADLQLRGPGNIEGKQQSGMLRFMIADLAKDGNILQAARHKAAEILQADPLLSSPDHTLLRDHMAKEAKENRFWSNIS